MPSPITTISFAITTVCNRRCPDCCAGIGRVASWSADERYFERWAPLFRGVEIINIYGGEPTNNPRFAAISGRLREWFPGSVLWLSTNGDLWDRHADAIDLYDFVVASHYGSWTYPGCPDNTAEVLALAEWFKGRVKLDKAVHRRIDLEKSKPCSALHSGALEFRKGVLHPCCTGSGTLAHNGIVPDADWREKILAVIPDCTGCPFAT